MRCKPPLKKPTDHTGKKFNMLTAIRYAPKDRELNRSSWLCRCDCGKERVISTSHLISGRTKSCGCLTIEKTIERNLARIDPTTHLRTWYNNTKRKAAKRGIPFSLTTEQYEELALKQCHYCGRLPSNSTYSRLGGYRPLSGIDRIDSTGSYEMGNCRPCCKDCNYAKGQLTEEAFKTLVENIYDHWIKNYSSD